MRVRINEWEENNIIYYELSEDQVKLLKELEKLESVSDCMDIDYLDEKEYKEVE
jgi:hypothetical protein